MAKQTGPTSEQTRRTIGALRTASRKQKKKVWASLADRVSRPARIRATVSTQKLCRLEKKLAGKTAAVPGKVVGNTCPKKISVAALSYSKSAKTAIEKAGGSAQTLAQAAQKTTPSQIVIVE